MKPSAQLLCIDRCYQRDRAGPCGCKPLSTRDRAVMPGANIRGPRVPWASRSGDGKRPRRAKRMSRFEP